jgi:hypothetical protein
MGLLSRLRSVFSASAADELPAEPPPAPDILLTDDGFTVGARTVRWSAVTRVTTYKIDFFAVDCICLSFELDGEPTLELTEESNGFNDFMDELHERFPTIPADWYATVMQPPFARNEAVLFTRETTS